MGAWSRLAVVTMIAVGLVGCGFEPEEGRYNASTDADANSACDDWNLSADDVDSSLNIGIDHVDDGDFELTVEDSDPYDCSYDGHDFFCSADFDSDVDGYDATVHEEDSVDGTFDQKDSFTATLEFTLSCSGSDCGGLNDCRMTVELDASL